MSKLVSVILPHMASPAPDLLEGRLAGPSGTEMRMARHRVSVTFSLSAKQVELLDRLAQRTNVPKSVYVRKGVDVILRRYRDVLHGEATASGNDEDKQ